MSGNMSPAPQEENPQDGKKALREGANDWSSAVGTLGVQATYAIIGANWAVQSKIGSILSNTYSKLSVGVCIVFLMLTLILTSSVTELLRLRWQKAEAQPEWWKAEWEARAASKWPYTEGIERLALWLRYLKVASPIIAGFFFILSLF